MLTRDTSRHKDPKMFIFKYIKIYHTNCKKQYTYIAILIQLYHTVKFKAELLLEIEAFHYGGRVNPPKKM